jgi:hypothetical protein
MNIINRFLLGVVLSPKAFYKKLGVNISHLKAILTTRLIMDDRRPNTFQQAQQKKPGKPVGSATTGTMLMSAVLGLFYLYAFKAGQEYATKLTLYFSMYIFMLASTLISDFTSVLIDVRDNYIILPKPVNDRTVIVSRLLHILIHISKLVMPMALPGAVFIAIKMTLWGSFLFCILIVLNTLFTIFLVNALYIIILRITTPQKFQSVIAYFQVGFAIFIYGGYQVVLRVIDEATLQHYNISDLKYIWLVPSYWFAGAWQGLSAFDMQPQWIIAAALSLTLPFISIWIVIKYFAPSFNEKLSEISASDPAGAPVEKAAKTITATKGYASRLATLFTIKGAEQMGFLFCWKMTARSKDFKMKVYPSFGYVAVYMFILFYNSKDFSWQSFRTDPTQGKILLLSVIYFSSLIMIMAINQLAYSEKFKAAWFYFTAPLKAPGLLISGAVKAVMLKYYIPIIGLLAAPAVYLVGLTVIPHLLLGLSNLLLICFLMAYLNDKYLPFSASQTIATKNGAFIRSIFTLIIPGIFGIIHYFLYDFSWVICMLAFLSVSAAWLVISSIKKTSWTTIKSTYE